MLAALYINTEFGSCFEIWQCYAFSKKDYTGYGKYKAQWKQLKTSLLYQTYALLFKAKYQ